MMTNDESLDISEEAFKRKIEELILYPSLSELAGLLPVLDALAAKQRWYMMQAFDIGSKIEDLLEVYLGEETELAAFRPGDMLILDGGRSSLDTSSLFLAASVLTGEISDPYEAAPSCEEYVRQEFWKTAAQLKPRELFFLIQACSKRVPRMPADLGDIREAIEEIARKYGAEAGGENDGK